VTAGGIVVRPTRPSAVLYPVTNKDIEELAQLAIDSLQQRIDDQGSRLDILNERMKP
jgi:hypothetical protein